MKLLYKAFRGGAFTTWNSLLQEVSDFGTRLGPERIVSISQSEDANEAVVTVWYWSAAPMPAVRKALRP